MTTPASWENFDDMFTNDVKRSGDAPGAPYGSAIAALLQLSGRAAAEGAIADRADEARAALIVLVQQASQSNLSQAELADRIQALGSVAVGIAKQVDGLGHALML